MAEQVWTKTAIQNWLVEQLAAAMKVDRSKIDVKEPFTDYALDSVAALRVVGQLEELLGRQLEPTLLYDHPDIESLSAYLAAQ
jgi:acyl carrier protein